MVEMRTILAKVETEKRIPSEAEQTSCDKLKGEVTALDFLRVADLYEKRNRQTSGEGATAYYRSRDCACLLNPYRVMAM